MVVQAQNRIESEEIKYVSRYGDNKRTLAFTLKEVEEEKEREIGHSSQTSNAGDS